MTQIASVSTGGSGISNGLYQVQDLITLPFVSMASLELGLGKTMVSTISSEPRARLNFSESLFLLIHFHQFSLQGVKEVYIPPILFLNSRYFFKIFRKIADSMRRGSEM